MDWESEEQSQKVQIWISAQNIPKNYVNEQIHRKLYNHLSLLSIPAILKIGQWSCFHLTLFSLMIQRNGKVSSKWWMLGANLSTNEWCSPLRRSHGPLDFLQWKTQALWFIGHENTFTILLIFPNAPLTTIFRELRLREAKKEINFSTHILRLTLLPFVLYALQM